uniref:Uncharacterized protein n=1 Tax=Panagrolaimus sp. PS1159 TaxID=55785 RepID=A0AC35FSA3_9BILA
MRSSSKTPKKNGTRDTAKDIILGMEPSGRGPRRPKEGIAQTPIRKSPAQTIVVQKPDTSALNNLQNQVQQLRKQYNDLANQEQTARRRLEANQEAISKKMGANADNAISARSMDDLRRQLGNIENKLTMMGQDFGLIKGTVDRHTADIIGINSDVKNRPTVDPTKIATTTQQMDLRMRDLQTQLSQLKLTMDAEAKDRARVQQQQTDTINRLQDIIRQQESSKNEILTSLSRKGDLDKEKLSEENRRLNDKIQLITNEVTKNMNEREHKLKDDIYQKLNAMQAAMKQHDGQLESDKDNKKKLEERIKHQEILIEDLKGLQQNDKNKTKEKFQKVNEALASLEHYMEQGSKKMDKILTAEIQSRKLHEKGLLSKVNEVEEKLSNYLTGLSKSVEDARAGKENIKMPSLDTDALRREMESISADKNKMSMEGLLKLEEKISRIQQGLNRDRKAMVDTLSDVSDKGQINKVRAQVNKLDEIMDEVEKTQDRVRDKVERQIPEDLNELSAKVDNLKQQLTHRIDQEEEERYLAIKELQDAYNKLTGGSYAPSPASDVSNSGLKRDIDECKVAIKKLAESITTVKNVLDKKIQDETRRREQDVMRLENRGPTYPQMPPQQQPRPPIQQKPQVPAQ